MIGAAAALLSALVVRHVTLVDAASPPRPDHAVVIVDGRITAVGPAASLTAPPGATVLDGAGGVLIPGLWDMHAHLAGYPGALGLLVAHGVTGVRDMGNATPEQSQQIRGWQADIAAGRRVGPRIVAAGPTVDGARGITSAGRLYMATPAEAPDAVATLRSRGGAFVKVHDWPSREAYLALSESARAAGLPLAGHVPPAVSAEDAAAAGQASIEHLGSALGGVLLDASAREPELRAELLARMQQAREAHDETGLWRWAQAPEWLTARVASWSDARAERLVDAFRRHGTWHCPTLVILSPVARPRDTSALRFVYASAAAACRSGDSPTREPSPPRREAFARQLAFVGQLQRGGVGLLAGSDFARPDRDALEEFETCELPLPGLSLHEEMEWLVEAGLSPRDALAAATIGPARFWDAESPCGRIEAGCSGDVVLLEASPLDDIRNARRIKAVVLGGRVLDRAALDSLLDASAEDARAN